MSESLFDDSQLPSIETRMRKLLDLIGVEFRPCHGCKTPLVFVMHRNGEKAPYTYDGLNHFINCPQAERFKRK